MLATVCGHCQTVVAREGINFADHGKVGQIRDDLSPLMLGAEGDYRGRAFTLVGRLQLEYLDGTWSEWNMSFADGSFAWLAEAMGQYAVHRPVAAPAPGDSFEGYRPGQPLALSGRKYVVRNAGRARCIGGEGTLPFAVGGEGYQLPFVDLTSHGDDVGTIDFSDSEPRLFLGQTVKLEDLKLRGLRDELPPEHPMARTREATVQALNCPSCAGALERKTGLNAKSIHCQFCGSGIDVSGGPMSLFARQDWKGLPHTPIKLGAVGTFDGIAYEVIAIVVREAPQWSVSWTEFLLWSRDHGYRWLMMADGHFTLIEMMTEWPDERPHLVKARGGRYLKKEMNRLVVKQVVGELYWRVKAGDETMGTDYASPPYMLSKEETAEEISWSIGTYIQGAEVFKAFGLDAKPPKKDGVPWHQPSPVQGILGPLFKRYIAVILAIIVLAIGFEAARTSTVVASEAFTMALPQTQPLRLAVEAAKDTPEVNALMDSNTRWLGPIEVPDGPTTLEIKMKTQVKQSWIWFHFSLYSPDTGTALDFGEEISKYGEEGNDDGSLVVPNVQKGTYFLRIEPTPGNFSGKQTTDYEIIITRGVTLHRWWLVALGVLFIPLAIVSFRKIYFEIRRQNANA
ncbi:MAG: hypothetical protein ACI9OJ_000940 [Myxococcota bacterium]|jgi:hypothetical protein